MASEFTGPGGIDAWNGDEAWVVMAWSMAIGIVGVESFLIRLWVSVSFNMCDFELIGFLDF